MSTQPNCTAWDETRPVASHRSLPPVAVERKRHFWTTREIRIVRDVYPHHGIRPCLERLPGRSAGAIYQKVGQLGLKRPQSEGRPRERHKSTPAIDDYIRRIYQATPKRGDINKCAEVLCKPRWWVSAQARRLGLVVPRFRQPPWTPAEDELVRANAHKHPETIKRLLAKRGYTRTATAVTVRRKRLGLSTADDNHYTATGLAGLFGIDAKTVIGWIDKGWLKAKKRGTRRTAAQGGDMWWVRRRDARSFVVENAAAVDLRKVDRFWFIDLLAGPAA